MNTLERPYNDDQLVEGLQLGKERSFSILYNRFHQRVLFFARRYVPEADAQDITAEVFIQLWKKRTDFADTKSILAFLFVSVRNRCFNSLRDTRYRKEQEVVLMEELERSSTSSLTAEAVRLQLVELLHKEIEKLPAKMREVFLLSFNEGLKPAQIAECLGIHVKTVSNQKLSAINLLRQAVANHPLEAVLLLLLQVELNSLA